MELSQYQQYAVPALILIFFGWRYYRFHRVKKGLPGLLKNGALVVDVRSRGEFAVGRKASQSVVFDSLDTGYCNILQCKTKYSVLRMGGNGPCEGGKVTQRL